MKTISLISTKGGTAKSTSAISIANVLSQNHKVLLLDIDSNNSLTSHYIVNISEIENKTIRQLLKSEVNIHECLIPISNNLHLIPSEIELCLIERELSGITNQMFLLYDLLNEVQNIYDFIIIDSAPSMGLTTKLAIISSDIIIIPTQLEKWAVRGINATIQMITDCQSV